MDKNTITGFVLIALVLIGFSWYSQPSEEQLRARQQQDSIVAAQYQEAQRLQQEQEAKARQADLEAATDSTRLFYAHRFGDGRPVVLQNTKLRLTLNTKGGCIMQAEMNGKYKNQQGENVVLFDAEDVDFGLAFDGKFENIRTKDYVFDTVNQTDSSVVMRLTAANGGTLDLAYRLLSDEYMVDFTIQAKGLDSAFPTSTKHMNITWSENARQQEKGYDFENRYSSLTYKIKDDGTDYLSEASQEEANIAEALDWIAFKNQFFSCVLIAQQDLTQAHLTSTPQGKNSGYLKRYEADMQTTFDPTGAQPTQLQFYFGPNDYHLLQHTNELSSGKEDLELEDLVYLGWPLFKWINRWFIIYVFDWLSALGLPMGIVLLLLTIIVKVLVYPTTRKSYLSSAKMRVLKPKIDEINKRYPNQEDTMKKQQEIMQLYSRYGVSPMGGCLPMLIQMPIWIALFNFVPNAIELRGQSFLWASDLSAYDDVISWNTEIWGLGNHLSIFCLLFCATNIINTWVSMRQQQNAMGDPAQMKMMKYMMYLMPLMFFFMFNNYSSGLNYYYFLSGLTSILIMWYLRKTTDDKKLLAKLEANYQANKNNPQKMSGMAARLEALQKQQQAILEEQRRNRKK